MELVGHTNQGTYNVVMRGQFTFSDNPAFRHVLEQIGKPEVQRIVMHLEQVDFVDSAALGMLLLARDEAEKHQKSILLSGATGQVKKTFEMARFNMLFSMI